MHTVQLNGEEAASHHCISNCSLLSDTQNIMAVHDGTFAVNQIAKLAVFPYEASPLQLFTVSVQQQFSDTVYDNRYASCPGSHHLR